MPAFYLQEFFEVIKI